MLTACCCRSGIWGLLIASAVIGRIIEGNDSNPEVEDEDPSIIKQQAIAWSQEFFRSDPNPDPSYLDDYSDFTETSNREGRREQASASTPAIVKVENLEWMLRNIFTYPRSHSTNHTAKEIVKKYIAESFEYTSGIPTTIQYFKPQQFLSVYDDGDVPVGANVIGILRGSTWSTSLDKPIVVGAHWDTVNFTPGTDDNGSGVAAMLEAARSIAHSGCKPKYTIIFVAFDLEETGSQGSLVFIKEYLVDLLMTSGLAKETSLANFQGAFIMDTIMNFNDTTGSQTFPTDWSLLLPEVYDEVANEQYRGDFLGVIHRKEVDKRLAQKFLYHWTQAPESKLKIKSFPLDLKEDLPELEILSANLNFLRSDHARFWYMNDTEVPKTLNAVLITDTGPYRGNMRECYHTVCDGPEISVYDNKDNLKFLTKATQALVDTLLDLSMCESSAVLHNPAGGISSSGNDLLQQRGHSHNSAVRSDSPFLQLIRLLKWFETL